MRAWLVRKHQVLFLLSGAGLVGGGLAWWTAAPALAHALWGACIGLMLAVLAWDSASQLRRREAGVDVLALLTMAAALALGEYLARAVIAFMLASGHALEEYAGRRARATLTGLLDRAPRSAQRFRGSKLEAVDVDQVRPGDRLLVSAGETVPVDGELTDPSAVLDEAALTGEAAPVTYAAGAPLRSGAVNAGQAFQMRATATAVDSTYSAIVRLVEQAQTGKAPFTRLADRYALWFIPAALVIAGAAWGWSGDAVRALAVLVVATPCPLILAAPVAIVSGISRAARRGVLIKNGAALEALAQARIVLFDKTGTLTRGSARLAGIETRGTVAPDELLRLAASLDQVSAHVAAHAIVAEARRRALELALPTGAKEAPGAGVRGRVDGREVAVGSQRWLEAEAGDAAWTRGILRRMALQGLSGVFVAVDGELQGALLLADDIRLETPKALRNLREAGVRRTVMVSGDRVDVAETIAAALGIDTVLAERSPADKVAAVENEVGGDKVIMVGDGVNDAPALAVADVGVAMGARGAAASADAADVVLMVDRIDRLADALGIAQRSRRIAWQSVTAGMGLSVAAMLVAAFGYLPPVWGALLQELIDVAVIVNALRALWAGAGERAQPQLPPEMVRHLRAEHDMLRPLLDRIDAATYTLGQDSNADARAELEAIATMLRETLLPHEREDEERLYPQLAKLLRGVDPMAAMSRTHREIFHLARLYEHLVAELPPDGALPDFELHELRRLLFSLGAILRLHFAQEEEMFQTVAPE